MNEDEQAIRALVAEWVRATAEGDLSRVLSQMAEDVVFLQSGRPPMRGRSAFAEGFESALQHNRIEVSYDIREIRVEGNWAYCWNHLTVSLASLKGGSPVRRVGDTLSILNRQADGDWVVVRDANMLAPEPPGTG